MVKKMSNGVDNTLSNGILSRKIGKIPRTSQNCFVKVQGLGGTQLDISVLTYYKTCTPYQCLIAIASQGVIRCPLLVVAVTYRAGPLQRTVDNWRSWSLVIKFLQLSASLSRMVFACIVRSWSYHRLQREVSTLSDSSSQSKIHFLRSCSW